ncbi:MAG: hypothetical protein B7X77_01315, partial [Caulobacter sp. 39-67-4]
PLRRAEWVVYAKPPFGGPATMALSPAEFIRRFLIHVLPSGFHRIRHYGLLAKGPNAVPLKTLRALILERTPHPAAVHKDPVSPRPQRP